MKGKAPRPRPFQDLGRFVRVIRVRRKTSQVELAAKTGMRNELISRLERGENVEIDAYDQIAKGLGFRGALEMFTSGGDDLTKGLLRGFAALPDDEARRDVLLRVRRMLVADVESGATSHEGRDVDRR